MEYSNVISAITTVGFPIVMCCAMGWYVKYITDKNRDEITKLNEQHKNEMNDVAVAINNNTIALQKLCDKIGDSDE